MPSLLQNKYLRYIVFGIGALIALFIFLVIILSSLNSARSTSWDSSSKGMAMNEMAIAPGAPSMDMDRAESMTTSYYPGPTPLPDGGYTSELERYETTDYTVSGRTRNFTEACATLTSLKASGDIHFKYLTEGINSCTAQFFVEESAVAGVIAQFDEIDGLTANRSTNSVTRHKQQIESQTDIIRRQLAAVNASLNEAEAAYDEIIALARETRNAETLNSAIRNKLEQIDYLSGRKINLTTQLDTYAQQTADLQERIDVVAFTVNITRSYPVQPGKYERKWENAWEDLRDQVTNTLIGVTAFFGIFLLLIVQYGLYLLVLIVLARFGWKLVQKVWRM